MPYATRESESSGLAQGVLALPSCLAVLAATAPRGPWLHWLQAGLAAALAMLAFLQLQSCSGGGGDAKARSDGDRGGSVRVRHPATVGMANGSKSGHTSSSSSRDIITKPNLFVAACVAAAAVLLLPTDAH